MGLVIYTPLTANQVNLLNRFLFQQLQLPWSPIRCTDERTTSQLHLLSLIMRAPAVSEGVMLSCASNDVQLHHRASRPILGRPVDSRLSSVNGDGVKLNPITGKLPVSSNPLPVLLKNGFNIPMTNPSSFSLAIQWSRFLYPNNVRRASWYYSPHQCIAMNTLHELLVVSWGVHGKIFAILPTCY